MFSLKAGPSTHSRRTFHPRLVGRHRVLVALPAIVDVRALSLFTAVRLLQGRVRADIAPFRPVSLCTAHSTSCSASSSQARMRGKGQSTTFPAPQPFSATRVHPLRRFRGLVPAVPRRLRTILDRARTLAARPRLGPPRPPRPSLPVLPTPLFLPSARAPIVRSLENTLALSFPLTPPFPALRGGAAGGDFDTHAPDSALRERDPREGTGRSRKK